MKQENIAKVWAQYRGYIMQYHIWYPEKIKEAVQKNIDGDFSPAQFFDSLHSKIHLEIQRYIKYLLDLETQEILNENIERTTTNNIIEPLGGLNDFNNLNDLCDTIDSIASQRGNQSCVAVRVGTQGKIRVRHCCAYGTHRQDDTPLLLHIRLLRKAPPGNGSHLSTKLVPEHLLPSYLAILPQNPPWL